MILYFYIYLAVINLAAFFMFGLDKRRARINGELEKARRKRKPQPVGRNKQRIPEKTLFVVAALGGSIGAILGMWIFRHKTRHCYFTVGLPGILILQLLVAWIAVRGI